MLRITRTDGPNGETVLALAGSLSAEAVSSLAAELERTPTEAALVLDLADLTFVDHAGIELLRRASRRARLSSATPYVEAVLKGSGDEERE